MHWNDRVVWQEGMFLRAQHFQQQDRHFERQMQARVGALSPYAWGITEMSVDRDLLAAGKFALTACSGILEDGTPFGMPGETDPPPPLDLPEGTRNAVIHLAAPVRQPGVQEVAYLEGPEAMRARLSLSSFDAHDTHSDSTMPAELQVGRLKLRYMLDGEDRTGFTTIGLVRVTEVHADRRTVLDERFIAPCLRTSATPVLSNLLPEIAGMLGQRGEALAMRLGQPGSRGVAEITDFMLLQVVNRWQGLLAHWANAGHVHPERLYSALVAMAGELATFTDPKRRPTAYPGYRHEDLQRSFAPVVADLRRALSSVLEQTAEAIPLQEKRHGVRVGQINDRNLLRGAGFVLVVRADLPTEQLLRLFPHQAKIGAVEHIRELVSVAMPGISLRPLPVAPRQIPYHAGSAYFELDRSSQHWALMQNSGGFAIHVSGQFPNLHLELWAIRT